LLFSYYRITYQPTPCLLEYYNLHPEATIRDVVVAIRADEALHRDANHLFAEVFSSKQVNLRDQIKEQAQKSVQTSSR
jgi:ubiquinol oxidase